MKKVLITQRVDTFEKLNETRECLDIEITKFFLTLKIIPIPISSLTITEENLLDDYLLNFSIDGIVLSGGNDVGSFKKRDKLEEELLNLSQKRNIPLFGICRGCQMINYFQNGTLQKINGHCNTRHLVNWVGGGSPRDVNSFHNYGINENSLGYDLQPLAFAQDGTIEALKHNIYPWLAIMWHPEREKSFSQFDLELISNHFKN